MWCFGVRGKGLLTWLGGRGKFCLGALLGGLQQDLPHLQTDTDINLPKHCPDPVLPPTPWISAGHRGAQASSQDHLLELCPMHAMACTGTLPASLSHCSTARTFWLRVRSRDVWQRRCLCPACHCPCVESLELVLCSAAGAGSPRSMATSCSSGSVSVSLLASDEDRLMGSSFSHKTSAPVRKGWHEAGHGSDLVPGTTQHRQPEPWGGRRRGSALPALRSSLVRVGEPRPAAKCRGVFPANVRLLMSAPS